MTNVVQFPNADEVISTSDADYERGMQTALEFIQSIGEDQTADFLDGLLDTLADFMYAD